MTWKNSFHNLTPASIFFSRSTTPSLIHFLYCLFIHPKLDILSSSIDVEEFFREFEPDRSRTCPASRHKSRGWPPTRSTRPSSMYGHVTAGRLVGWPLGSPATSSSISLLDARLTRFAHPIRESTPLVKNRGSYVARTLPRMDGWPPTLHNV